LFKVSQGKDIARSYLEIKPSQKRADGVAQGVGPGSSTNIAKKKKNVIFYHEPFLKLTVFLERHKNVWTVKIDNLEFITCDAPLKLNNKF
jgi:hypothetical protein